ncbi:MAG: HRDC domain-containing protein [Planctomycetota bacterium]
MRVKLFTFRYSATLGGFDEDPLQHFLSDKEVVAFREHFYAVNDVPHVTCVVTWQDAIVPDDVRGAAPKAPRASRRSERADPTAGLDERERALFNTLREWRRKKAHDEGVPPYVVLTNRELVEVVARKPDSPTALANVPGIGRGKIERHGAELLAQLGHALAPSAAAEPAAEAAS